MRTLNKAELIQKFLDLKTRPHAENGFNAVTISDDSTHRLGISPEGYPTSKNTSWKWFIFYFFD